MLFLATLFLSILAVSGWLVPFTLTALVATVLYAMLTTTDGALYLAVCASVYVEHRLLNKVEDTVLAMIMTVIVVFFSLFICVPGIGCGAALLATIPGSPVIFAFAYGMIWLLRWARENRPGSGFSLVKH